MSEPALVGSGWAPVRGPFFGLQAPLAEAERRLNSKEAGHRADRWGELAAAVEDPDACTAVLNDLLGAVLGGWQLRRCADRWRVTLIGNPDIGEAELAAAQAVALLVESCGWSRLKQCARTGCPHLFLDSTNGGIRRWCSTHSRHRDQPGADHDA